MGAAAAQVKGEYGLSETLLGAGYNLATLMARYAPSTDWRDQRHWRCNNNVHPSRHGTYDGISMHPFETVFTKARCGLAVAHKHVTAHGRVGDDRCDATYERFVIWAALFESSAPCGALIATCYDRHGLWACNPTLACDCQHAVAACAWRAQLAHKRRTFCIIWC